MAFSYRKSKRVAPGVRLNLGSRSAGLSMGARGLRFGMSTLGRGTLSVGRFGFRLVKRLF